MAGETSQIAKMAIKLSEKIFPLFYWDKVGSTDINGNVLNQINTMVGKNILLMLCIASLTLMTISQHILFLILRVLLSQVLVARQ